MKLSARLQQISDQLPEGCTFADIGSDHAMLPVASVFSGRARSAIAGEVNEGPYESAQRQVMESGLQRKVSVRKGNGLEVLKRNEVDVITIAGMGGALIVSILSAGADKLAGVQRLILQPNVGEDLVRRWLLEHRWYLSAEQILEEDGKIYEILTADWRDDAQELNQDLYEERVINPSTELRLTRERLIEMGPRLTQQPQDVFFAKWHSEVEKLHKVYGQIAKSDLESSKSKAAEMNIHIRELEEVLSCMQKDRR
ncbi:tRNA (adenine22-N1)-methyltransferase [Paenibacillus shirakamiensis]|uniref:tRNA (Adenine22-N1)-methyltransferase n=1 Tax=Paenibacillus shirakamiensis TaxID=1265935 RepID=A0ABS4JBT5_9BACL|nr:class I SAM-dependent methyltransferase [Paenibacillus shirakamiensis]MBP1999182.1 tRNA (adenine22-N1)-methyltransferase [Paenibacillus shirakamiensis]